MTSARSAMILLLTVGVLSAVGFLTEPAPASEPRPSPISTAAPPALSRDGETALKALMSSDCFKSNHVGFAGQVPAEVIAFRTLMREKAATQAFLELSASKNLSAQLYGLSGLYLLDRTVYSTRAKAILTAGGEVCTFIGCIMSRKSVADVIGTGDTNRWEISGGLWPQALAKDK